MKFPQRGSAAVAMADGVGSRNRVFNSSESGKMHAALAVAAALTAGWSLFGWMVGITVLTSFSIDRPSLSPMTALGLLLAAAASLSLRPSSSLARFLSSCGVLLGIVILITHAVGWTKTGARWDNAWWSSSLTGMMFLLAGVSAFALAVGHRSFGQATAFGLLLLAVLLGLGHAFPDADLYIFLPGTGVSIPTVLAFVFLSMSQLLVFRHAGIASAMSSKATAGRAGLRLFFIGSSAVIVLAGGVLLARHHHKFDAETAVLLMAWGALGLLGVTLWTLAVVVDRADDARIAAENQSEDVRRMVAAALTHDLRAPLHTATVATQVLERMIEAPKGMVLIQQLKRGHRRIDRLLRSLLDSLALDSGKTLTLQASHFSLEDLVGEVLSENSGTLGERVLVHGTGVKGCWDREALFRVVENLLLNAVKYGTDNDIRCDITDRGADHQKTVALTVHNHGLAIPAAEWEAIFQPFTRGEHAGQRPRSGWGVGLAYAQLVAAAHGGTVRVASSDASGTVFELRLPQDARPFLREVGPALTVSIAMNAPTP